MTYDKWTKRTVISLIVLVAAWTFVALVGRARGESPYAEPDPTVTLVLVICLLTGVGLSLAVPVMSLISIDKSPAAGKLIGIAAILVEITTIVLSLMYIFPHGLGR